MRKTLFLSIAIIFAAVFGIMAIDQASSHDGEPMARKLLFTKIKEEKKKSPSTMA